MHITAPATPALSCYSVPCVAFVPSLSWQTILFQINMPLQEKTVSHLPQVDRASAAVAVGVAAAAVECKASTQKNRRSAPPQQPCPCRHYYRHS
eukprot:COSAG06_NODE_4488_length_4209_cov_3.108759_2_plen_94_part_00